MIVKVQGGGGNNSMYMYMFINLCLCSSSGIHHYDRSVLRYNFVPMRVKLGCPDFLSSEGRDSCIFKHFDTDFVCVCHLFLGRA